jgi:hypothetical protein
MKTKLKVLQKLNKTIYRGKQKNNRTSHKGDE